VADCKPRVSEDVANAMDYLHRVHQPRVIHRDLKPQNIMIDHSGRAHLARGSLRTGTLPTLDPLLLLLRVSFQNMHLTDVDSPPPLTGNS
jgi:serine/threonine protein kinase